MEKATRRRTTKVVEDGITWTLRIRRERRRQEGRVQNDEGEGERRALKLVGGMPWRTDKSEGHGEDLKTEVTIVDTDCRNEVLEEASYKSAAWALRGAISASTGGQ